MFEKRFLTKIKQGKTAWLKEKNVLHFFVTGTMAVNPIFEAPWVSSLVALKNLKRFKVFPSFSKTLSSG
ncbi:MAG: hypothetical protein PVG99_09805 [Desulfobacteraceae bacterium]|jgi:hypothetical protein